VTMVSRAKAAHVASCLSCIEILTSLYFDLADLDPWNPKNPRRDRIILSKGHAAPALYACLAERGFFPREMLDAYGRNGSSLGEHVSYGLTPGVECTTGSLGHGLGVGIGMAKAIKSTGRKSQVHVVMSDGECNEGSVWEAALWAPKHELNNLTAWIDMNGWQATDRTENVTSLNPMAEKWRSFGWEVLEADGHDFPSLLKAGREPRSNLPRVILAQTVKGKGVSFMENDLEWHYRPPMGDEFIQAMSELGD